MAVPLNVTVPPNVASPATFKFPPTPTPPLTVNAPPLEVVLCVALVIDTAWLVVAPRPVTDCSVLASFIVIDPVVAERVISVPLIKFVTPKFVSVTDPVDAFTAR